MDYATHLSSLETLNTKLDSAIAVINELSKTLLDIVKPPTGPYILFSSIAILTQRSKEIKLIADRLYSTRIALFENDTFLYNALPQPLIKAIPAELLMPYQQGLKLDGQIALDFQTMLLFIGIALDDWTHVAAHVVGTKNPERASFDKIAKDEGTGDFALIWSRHREAILWIDAFPRLYRNKMIVHRERPWQISHGHDIGALDWSFWTPILVGWVSDVRLRAIEGCLERLAQQIGVALPTDIYGQVLTLLRNIAKFNRADRKSIYDIALETGFQTPSFQEFAHSFVDFLGEGTATLIEIAKANPSKIVLGGPSP